MGKAPSAFRLHQWEKTDLGVRGSSSAIPLNDDPLEKNRGFVLAKHAGETEGKGAMLRCLDARRV